MDQRYKEQLAVKAQAGAEMRELLKSPAYKMIESWVDAKVQDAHKAWLMTQDRDKREALWYSQQAYNEFQSFLKRVLIEGDQATKQLAGQDDL